MITPCDLIEAADVSQQAVTQILRAESGIRRFPRNIGKFIPHYMVSGVSVDVVKVLGHVACMVEVSSVWLEDVREEQ